MRKKIKDYENYEVDEQGNVFNLITNQQLKGSISENGYKYFRLSKDGKKKMVYAHRLVAECYLDNPGNYPVVNHIDGDKLNNSIENLEWCSYSQNATHAHQNNLISSVREREYYDEDLAGEIWKPIFNLPYSISNKGRIKNDRTLLLLKPSLCGGYYKIRPSANGQVQDFMVHNILYCVFNDIQTIPEGMVVDHIDGNKTNNCLDNLRLITLSENVKAALYETKTNKSCKAVQQYSLEGKLLNTFPSAREAARVLGLDSSTISKVCRGVNKTHGGFVFKYVE